MLEAFLKDWFTHSRRGAQEIPSPGCGFQGSRLEIPQLATCKILASQPRQRLALRRDSAWLSGVFIYKF